MFEDPEDRNLSDDEYKMLAKGIEKLKRDSEAKYGKRDPLKIFYISNYEAKMITNWTAEN